MAKKTHLELKVKLPSGVTASMTGKVLNIKGKAGEANRTIVTPLIQVSVAGDELTLKSKGTTQPEKMHIYTIESHVVNMVAGVQKPFIYELKICSGHFPMSAAIKGDLFELKNFLGEAVPRKLKIKPGAKVTITAETIKVESPDKEIAGMVAAALEQLTRITNRDRRVFQDGIYITTKAGQLL